MELDVLSATISTENIKTRVEDTINHLVFVRGAKLKNCMAMRRCALSVHGICKKTI